MSDELSPEVFDAVCRQADQAARAQERLAQANTEAKNELLLAIADALDEHAADIEAANALDMLESKENGMDAGKLDRLLFDVPRVAAAAQGVRHVATLPDPVGEIVRGYNLPNGLRLTQTRVPMGVIGMIYEAGRTSLWTWPACASSPAMPRCCEAATPPNALTPPRWASSPRCLKPTVSNPHWCNPSTSTGAPAPPP